MRCLKNKLYIQLALSGNTPITKRAIKGIVEYKELLTSRYKRVGEEILIQTKVQE